MLSDRELSAAIGSTAYGPDGNKIGTVEHFFVDDRTGAPTWVAITTGLFGTRHSIVPAVDATFGEGHLQLPVTKDAVRSAPSVGDSEHLDPGEESVLREHYGLAASGNGAPSDTAVTDTAVMDRASTGTDTSRNSMGTGRDSTDTVRNSTDTVAIDTAATKGTATAGAAATGTDTHTSADGAMIRSEERLRVATEQTAATRVRVVRYVVTEEVQVTVPVRREEIRLEEVPLDAPDPGPGESLVDQRRDARRGTDAGVDGPGTAGVGSAAIGGGLPEEIILHREEPVVSVRVVAAERVRLRTEVVAGEERVSAQVQREQIAVDQEPIAQGSIAPHGGG